MVYHKLTVMPAAFMSIALSVSLYASDPIGVEKAGWWNRPDDELRNLYLDGTSYLSMKSAMKTAPEIIHTLVAHLKDPNKYKRPEWRFMWLYGPSGSGKSTLAKAIAAYSGFDLLPRCPDDFQNGKRGEAAQAFKAELRKMASSEAETVMLLEEGNGMLDNHNDPRYDDAESGRSIWTGFDFLRGKHKSFVLVTANIIQNVPKQVKTRGKMRQCKIDLPVDLASRVGIAMDVIKADGYSEYVDESLLKICLERLLPYAPDWKCRDFAEYGFDFTIQVTNAVNKVLKELSDSKKTISPEEALILAKEVQPKLTEKVVTILFKSFNDCLAAEKEWNYDKIELTNIDRENIHQVQNLYAQSVVASENAVPWILRGWLEFLGLKEPVGKRLADVATYEQHKLVSDGKMKMKTDK